MTTVNSTALTPVGKFVVALLCFALIAVVWAAGAAATRPHAQAWRCVLVRPGDTLWGLAGRVSSGDRREVIDKIVDRNRLSGSLISPGAALWVPVGERGYAAEDSECGITP